MTTDRNIVGDDPQDDLGWLLEAWDLGREPDWTALQRSGRVDETRLEGLRRAHLKYESSKALVRRRPRDEPLLSIGHVLGDFHIVDRVGKGGMGEVYRARQQSLGGREVALKVMHPEHRSQTDIERFARGARALSGLTHAHLVQVHGYGEANGLHYLVMRLVEGDSIADRIRGCEGGIDAAQAARWIEQIASALAVVHGADVVHRDVKPSNIVLDESDGDAAVLVDFGVARPVDDATHTQPGHAPVTPAFAAPEQLDDRRVDARSDVYSLGLVLVDLLRGHDRRFRSPVGIDQLEGADPDLVAIATRCTAEDPAQRYASARELHADLVAWREGRALGRRTRRGPRSEWPRVLGVVVVIGLLGAGVLLVDRVGFGAGLAPDVAGPGLQVGETSALERAAAELASTGLLANANLVDAFLVACDDPARSDTALDLLARALNERPTVDPAELAAGAQLRARMRRIEDDASARQPKRLAATSVLSSVGDAEDARRFAVRLATFEPIGEEPRLTFEALERVVRRAHRTGEERRVLEETPWQPLLDRIRVLREQNVEMSWEQGAAIVRFVSTLHLARRRCGLPTDALEAMPLRWREAGALPWSSTLDLMPVSELAAAGDSGAKHVLDRLNRRRIRDWQAELLGRVVAYLDDESFRASAVDRLVELGWPRDLAASSLEAGRELGVANMRDARCNADTFEDGGHFAAARDPLPTVPIPLVRAGHEVASDKWEFTHVDPPAASGMAVAAAGTGAELRSEGGDLPYLLLSEIGSSSVVLNLHVPTERRPARALIMGQTSARRYLPFQGFVILEFSFDGMPLDSRRSSSATSSITVVDLPPDWLIAGDHQFTIRLGGASTTSFRLLSVCLVD